MPPRQAHRKSRSGCQPCKSRRVKCDETRPGCRNCNKRGISCEYLNSYHHASRPSSSPLPLTESDRIHSPLPLAGPTSPYADPGDIEHSLGPDERRMLELRLIHHFTTVVVYTFPACNEARFRDLWVVDAVRTAFEHPFLFNAILAISSLHRISDTSPTTYFYQTDENPVMAERIASAISFTNMGIDLAKAHRIYLTTAIRQQREAISNLGPTNADAIFMASLLLSYQSLNLIPDQPTAFYSPPIEWLKMSKAVHAVVGAAGPMVHNESILALMLSYTTEPDFKDRAAMFNPAYRRPFEALLDWSRYPERDLNVEDQEAYEETLAYVGGVYRAFLNNEAPRVLVRRLVCLGVLAPPRFTTLLEQGRPRALAILAHHFALSRAVDEHWWFHGMADRVVSGIQSILPAEWQWAMVWPLSMIRIARLDDGG
jgi:Fungal Zn(2)-Cys(6) binuclear cluster domain